MPHIDQIVLSIILVGLIASVADHWRHGQRGRRLATLTFCSFFGVALVTMLAGHCADIIYNLVRANRSVVDGSTFTYNWRTYSLLVLAITLPTIPVHAFFGTLMSGWSSIALIVAAAGLRGTPQPTAPASVRASAAS